MISFVHANAPCNGYGLLSLFDGGDAAGGGGGDGGGGGGRLLLRWCGTVAPLPTVHRTGRLTLHFVGYHWPLGVGSGTPAEFKMLYSVHKEVCASVDLCVGGGRVSVWVGG